MMCARGVSHVNALHLKTKTIPSLSCLKMENSYVLHLDMDPAVEGPCEEFDINQFTCIEVRDVGEPAASSEPVALDSMTVDELKAACAAAMLLERSHPSGAPTTVQQQVQGVSKDSTFSLASKLNQSHSSPNSHDADDEHEWMCKLTSSMAEAAEEARCIDTALPLLAGRGPTIDAPQRQGRPHSSAEEIMSQFNAARVPSQESSDGHGDACRAAFMDVLSKYSKPK
jgi:hypothetical protein